MLKDLNDIIAEARENYLRLDEDANEANTINRVVEPLLIRLGYKKIWIYLEERPVKGRVFFDIIISLDNKKTHILTIEVKKKGTRLGYNEKKQTLNYVNENKSSPWAILTNSEEWILLNNDIIGDFDDREIFTFNLFDDRTNNILKYFSYEFIFVTNVTTYFKHVTQFKAFYCLNNNPSSFIQYQNTLFNFFDYLSENENLYIELSSVRVADFEKYINIDKTNKIKSKKRIPEDVAIVNKYAHISGMYEALIKRNQLKENPFYYKAEEYRNKISKNKKIPISIFEYENMIGYYTGKSDETRNKLIIKLLFFIGMSRSEIMLLQESQIKIKSRQIIFDNRILELDDELVEMINKYREIKKSKGFKSSYLFPSKYSHCKNNPLWAANYNRVVNESLNSEVFSKERKKEININLIKETLILKWHSVGLDIPEIAYYMGLSISTICSYFEIDEIYNNIDKQKFVKNHPFNKIIKRNN